MSNATAITTIQAADAIIGNIIRHQDERDSLDRAIKAEKAMLLPLVEDAGGHIATLNGDALLSPKSDTEIDVAELHARLRKAHGAARALEILFTVVKASVTAVKASEFITVEDLDAVSIVTPGTPAFKVARHPKKSVAAK